MYPPEKLGDFGKHLKLHYSFASVVVVPIVSEFSVTDWVSVVDSVLAGSVAAGSVVRVAGYVVVLLGSVVFVDSLSPVASGGVVSTGVLVSVEGVVVLSEV